MEKCILTQQEELGSIYRDQDHLRRVWLLKQEFDSTASKFNSELLGLPLISPAEVYIGNNNKPIPERLSGRVARIVTPDNKGAAFRYEGTAPTTHYAANQLQLNPASSLRYHYIDEMIRLEESNELDGRHYRTFQQLGIEMFTRTPNERFKNIAEMTAVNIQFLTNQGLTPSFRVSHTDLIAGFLSSKGYSPYTIRRVAGLMEDSSIEDIKVMLSESDISKSEQNTLLYLAELRETPFSDAVKNLQPLKSKLGHIINDVAKLSDIIDTLGISNHCSLDPGILRSLNFYDGFTLQIDVNGHREIAGGGEYPSMLKAFSGFDDALACGSAIGLERLISVLENDNEE